MPTTMLERITNAALDHGTIRATDFDDPDEAANDCALWFAVCALIEEVTGEDFCRTAEDVVARLQAR